jgi:hypothetical protein
MKRPLPRLLLMLAALTLLRTCACVPALHPRVIRTDAEGAFIIDRLLLPIGPPLVTTP